MVEKETQTLPKVKRWVSQSVAPMLAVIYPEDPGGQAWLERQIIAGKRRWKEKHRGLLKKEKSSSSKQDAGESAGAPYRGVRGCRKTAPAFQDVGMLLTVKDLSAWLKIKPSTLYLWAAQGKIPCRRSIGLIRFDPEAITLGCDSLSESRQATAIPPLTRNLRISGRGSTY